MSSGLRKQVQLGLGAGLLAILYAFLSTSSQISFEQHCNGLQNLLISSKNSSFTIDEVTFVPAGSLSVTHPHAPITKTNDRPFCRVIGQTPYSGNNSVSFEVWLPDTATYDNRLVVVGNGGMAGYVDELSLMYCISQNHACSAGNSGHLATENNNGVGAPGVRLPYLQDREQTLAWIRNSIAYITPPTKEIIEIAYGKKAKHAYFAGCSTGGAQGFALAQYHPELFDGIDASCPGNWYSRLALSFLWNSVEENSPSFLPQTALDLITNAAIDKCDTLDGVADRVIENPLTCDFDIESLECRNPITPDSPACLTQEQISLAKKIYKGPENPRTGASLYPGFSVGSESGWSYQQSQLAGGFTIPLLQNLAFDLAYNASEFDWDNDVDTVDREIGTLIDHISPSLEEFRRQGGKMVVTQAWADQFNAALWPIQHREKLLEEMTGNLDDWFALFMVPCGGHCTSSPQYPQVPGTWHSLETLIAWVEQGKRPTEMLSTGPIDGRNRTRKLCPWPKTAYYNGGDVDEWTSFSCRHEPE